MADTTHAPIGEDAALAQLVAAVEAETDPGWDCNSYHPSLWPALKAARAALSTAAQRDALDQGVREELSIGKAINRAARDLPEGWEIRIDLERHAGVVFLIDPDGNETMSEGGELFSDQINAAIDAAKGESNA